MLYTSGIIDIVFEMSVTHSVRFSLLSLSRLGIFGSVSVSSQSCSSLLSSASHSHYEFCLLCCSDASLDQNRVLTGLQTYHAPSVSFLKQFPIAISVIFVALLMMRFLLIKLWFAMWFLWFIFRSIFYLNPHFYRPAVYSAILPALTIPTDLEHAQQVNMLETLST